MPYTICFDPGHGGIDTGAQGNGLYESQEVLPITLEAGEIVSRHGVNVIYTRNTDVYVGLSERAIIANTAKVNYFISIHANSATTNANGTETFAYAPGGQGEKLAEGLQEAIVISGIATANRGVKFANFAVLRETLMPSALLEILFISNAVDAEILKNRKHDIAVAIAKGVIKFLAIPYNSDYENPISPKPAVMYRVILDDIQVEALSYQDKAEEAVRNAVDSGRAKYGKVQRNTDGVDLYYYPPMIDYEKELCRIIVNGNNLIALTGKTKCVDYAKVNYEGHIVVQCVKDNVIVAEFDNLLSPPPPVEPPKPQGKPIMGSCDLTKEKMVKYVLDNNNVPKISITLDELAQLFLNEGVEEGVRGDIAFCQSILETGFFKYGGLVLPEQNNYGGISAVNNSDVGAGAWFNTPQEGVRAQIQHLKAYGSTEALKNPCIDPRFSLVTRGTALNWEDLNGKWSVPGENYGQKIVEIYNKVKEIVIEEPADGGEANFTEEEKKLLIKLLNKLITKLINKII